MNASPTIKHDLQPEIPAPPVAMVEALIMQFEGALTTMKVPDYVEEAARNFITALRKWSGGGQ